MKIIRNTPGTVKPPRIVCTGCGKRAPEAGCAVPDTVFARFAEESFMMLEDDETQPLCEACLAVMERAEA